MFRRLILAPVEVKGSYSGVLLDAEIIRNQRDPGSSSGIVQKTGLVYICL